MRIEATQLLRDVQTKEEHGQRLSQRHEEIKTGIDRNAYVERILDIIKQIHKQNAEIDKVFLCLFH